MYKDVSKLQEFYSTVRGKVVARTIRKKISKMWKSAEGDRVVGFGFASPYISSFINQGAENYISLIPREYLGDDNVNNTINNIPIAVCTDNVWPIESNSVNRVVIVHSLYSERLLSEVLDEAWRVLVAEGRLMIIVPNRSGVWARIDNNPFGDGSPYSMSQIRDILSENNFNPEREERALFFPPAESRFILATTPVWENLGYNLYNALGGVNIIEANKRVYAKKGRYNLKKEMNHNGVYVPSGSVSTNSSH